jgi:hypothetical protein
MAEPTVEEVREHVEEDVSDFDEDEWEEKLDAGHDKFGKFGGDGFVAWAVAYKEYGVEIPEADYSIPGGGGGGGGQSGSLDDNLDVYDIAEIEPGVIDVDNDEQFEVRGYLMSDPWEGQTSQNNPKMSLRLRDETGARTISAYGETNMENLQSADLGKGDWVRIRGATAFEFDGDDERVVGVSLPYWAQFESDDPEFELNDVAKDFIEATVVNPGDFVYLSGMITDTDFNEYEGCAECAKKWDPDESRVCPGCGNDTRKVYRPGRIQVTSGGDTETVSFSPFDDFTVEDPLFEEIEVLGTYSEEDYEGTTYKQVEVDMFKMLGDVEEMDTGVDESESSSDDSEPSDDSEETESDLSDEAQSAKDKVIDFGHEMPAKSVIRILEKDHGIEDEDQQVEILSELRDDPDVDVKEEDATIEDRAWQKVMLEKK